MVGLWVVLGTLALGLVVGAVLRARDGRIRAARPARGLPGASGGSGASGVSGGSGASSGSGLTGAGGSGASGGSGGSGTADLSGTPGVSGPVSGLPDPVADVLDPASAVTLVQISTTFCAPCRHARAVLSSLADKTDGLHHVELDVTNQPEVAQALGILRTPTTLALAADGSELLRLGGVPKGSTLLDALQPHLAPAV